MRVFKDAECREWNMTVNLRAVKALRAIGVDIMDETGGGILALSSDVCALGDALWTLCKSQAEQRGITEEQFYDGLHGDSIDAAGAALVDAIIDFFPNARREILRRANQKMLAVQEKAIKLASERIDQMDCESVMNSQGSPELTPEA